MEGEDGGANSNPTGTKNKDLAMLFLPTRDAFPNKPYYEDGNPEMYSKECFEKRTFLKDNDTVLDSIRDFA
jgi:hypothetical protein